MNASDATTGADARYDRQSRGRGERENDVVGDLAVTRGLRTGCAQCFGQDLGQPRSADGSRAVPSRLLSPPATRIWVCVGSTPRACTASHAGLKRAGVLGEDKLSGYSGGHEPREVAVAKTLLPEAH